MRAVLVREFAPFDQIQVAEIPDPRPGPDEIVVEVFSIEVNYPDLLVIEGKYQNKPPLPFSPGKAAAGCVAAVGVNVRTHKVGDRVAAQVEYGAYAEKLVARAESCFPIPEGISFDDAAALGLVYQTAWFALCDRAKLQPTESVLVLGASGGIGVASLQVAKALGTSKIIAAVVGPENVEVALQTGADHAIDLNMPNLRESLRKRVLEITDGRGADVVIDPVGGEPNASALRALAWCGRIVIIGFASGEIPSIRANYLLVKNIAVIGLQWSDYRDRAPELVAHAQREIFAFYQQKKISPFISMRMPLDKFHKALQLLKDGKAQGKIILQVVKS